MNETLVTFIDTNMLFFICDFKKYAVDDWLEQLYDRIYIHHEIMEEILSDERKSFFQNKINKNETWQLFDPDNEEELTEEEFLIYQAIFEQTSTQFRDFQKERTYKYTTDMGDIAILSGCQFLKVSLITSQDSDFEAVIDRYDLKISDGIEEKEDRKIEVHHLLDIGNRLIQQKICSRSQYRQFLKAVLDPVTFDKIESRLDRNE